MRSVSAVLLLAMCLSLPTTARAGEPEPYTGDELTSYRYAEGPSRPVNNREWWTRFGDPSLNQLMKVGMDGSFDVKAAQSRIEEADAVVTQQLAPLMPTASWDSDITMAPTDSLGFGFGLNNSGAPPVYFRANSLVNARLELDISGRNVLGRRAAKKERDAAEEDVDSVRQTLSIDLARAYYDLVATRAQIELVNQQVQANEQLLELTELRFESGQATAVDVLQQRQQLAASKARVPSAVAQAQTAEQRLSVLIGEAPGREITTPAELPELPPPPGLGQPSDLLSHRPDLRALQHRLDGAEKRKKVSRRQFVPKLSVTGSAGMQAIWLDEWQAQGVWSLGAAVSVPLSTGGANYGRMKEAEAQQRTLSHQLSQATVAAIGQVEAALVAEEQRAEALELLKQQSEAASAAFEESTSRYSAGLAEYLTVLAALNASQAAQIEVLLAHRELLQARIDLHQALGDM